MLRDAGQRRDRDRDERERRPSAGDDKWAEQILRKCRGRAPGSPRAHSVPISVIPNTITTFGRSRVTSAATCRRMRPTSPTRRATQPRSAEPDSASPAACTGCRRTRSAKKLPPSSSPATFAPASVRRRKIDSGRSGILDPALDHHEAISTAAASPASTASFACRPSRTAALGRSRQPAARVRPCPWSRRPRRSGARCGEPTVGDDPWRQRECGDPDRHVHIEDGLPTGVAE